MAEEKLFENKIKQWLHDHECYHIKYWGGGQFTKSGVPDILACVNGYFIGIEVKGPRGRANALQKYNLKKIRESGGLCYIVYPSGWESLREILEGLLYDRFNRDDEREVLK